MGRRGRYHVAEIFYSLQGEGHRKGTVNVFVRFAGCNLQCNVAEHGFDCDTDFRSRETFANAEDLADRVADLWGANHNTAQPCAILTGGEPTLQLDSDLIDALQARGFYIAIETNGTENTLILAGVDWVSCSPKSKGVVLKEADEVRVVLATGQRPGDFKLPKADHYFVSPAFEGDTLQPGALKWCIDWCLYSPGWRLSVQDHKLWGVR